MLLVKETVKSFLAGYVSGDENPHPGLTPPRLQSRGFLPVTCPAGFPPCQLAAQQPVRVLSCLKAHELAPLVESDRKILKRRRTQVADRNLAADLYKRLLENLAAQRQFALHHTAAEEESAQLALRSHQQPRCFLQIPPPAPRFRED